MNIEQRIRKVAASKIKVRITKRIRSKGGFYVWFPVEKGCQGFGTAKSKAEALQMLLAKARCFDGVDFSITVRPPHNRPLEAEERS